MLIPKIETALNEQMNREFYSAYLYLSMSGYFEFKNFPGFAHWMRIQAQEEMTHAMKYYTYIASRGGKVALASIDTPDSNWSSPLQVFEFALAHEQGVTRDINAIVDLALSQKDHATHYFLQWFVSEQVEEEATGEDVVSRLKLSGDNGPALMFLDREFGNRQKEG